MNYDLKIKTIGDIEFVTIFVSWNKDSKYSEWRFFSQENYFVTDSNGSKKLPDYVIKQAISLLK